MFKYEYIGKEPIILSTFNIEANPGDVLTVDEPINNVLFVLVIDKKSTKEASE